MTKEIKVALIDKAPNRTDYVRHFNNEFEFDHYHLCSTETKKVLKRDVDIEIDLDAYDWIILVGSEALQNFTSERSITEHSGRLIDDKFLPVINPAMLAFKPEARRSWEESLNNILGYISGELIPVDISTDTFYGIDNKEEAITWINEALDAPTSYIACDTETTGLYPRDGHILGISLAYCRDHAVYILTDVVDEEVEILLQKLFTKKITIFHNAKFDLAMLEYHFNFEFPRIEDTMLMHYMLNENPGTHGLKQLALKHTKYGNYEQELHDYIASYCKRNGVLKSQFTWESIPFDVMQVYAAMDAAVTFEIYELMLEALHKNPKLVRVYKDILIPGMLFLKDCQDNGVPFDRRRLEEAQNLMEADIQVAIEKLYSFKEVQMFEKAQGKEFNPNSTVQLRSLLFDAIGLQPTGKKTGTGAHSTDAEVLGRLADQHPVPNLILAIRQKSKIKNTYLDKIIPQLDRDSRLRTNFNLHSTTSGRLSSSGKLNMQQIPRDNPIVKGCIRAKEGNQIVAMDLTTAEVYVAAALSGDRNLSEVFKSGGNFHSSIAKLVFRLPCEVEEVAELYTFERQAAKAVTFGIMYGAGPNKISQQVTKDSGSLFTVSDAQKVIKQYFDQFNRLKHWLEEQKEFIEANAYLYSTFGRKRRLENVRSADKGVASHEVRSGINFLVQSVSSDMNLLAAIDMNNYIKEQGLKSRIFALVHDSILAECPHHEIDAYSKKLTEFVQMDRGIYINGAPVGCDYDVGDDYSFGKYEKLYG
jgi:DNA polymerase I-like protein with 3'-5' exonuclease and polymerase domains|tara:strand:- start:10265 stop:12538 length:2274 start_codon:yes stop_codon:yes gene_type:complete